MNMINIKRWCLLLALSTISIGCSHMGPSIGSDDSDMTSKKITAADANIQLGMNFLAKGDVLAAKQKLLNALRVAPSYPPAWYTMAYYLEVTGQEQAANRYYLKAIALSPKSGDSQNNYGTFLCHRGKVKESLTYFVAATNDPNYMESGGAFENAGLCALLIPDSQLAKSYFNKAVLRDPNRTRSLTQLATIYYQQQNYPLAKQYLQRYFLKAKPTPETLLLAVKISQQTDGPQAARVYATQLTREFPTSPEAREVR